MSEAELIRAIVAEFTPSPVEIIGPGDDAAVIATEGFPVAVSTDTLTAGQDFLPTEISPFQLGARLAVQNLADVAAMGAIPLTLVVSLSLPGELQQPVNANPRYFASGINPTCVSRIDWVRECARGLSSVSKQYGVSVSGGDLGRSNELSLTATALGKQTQPAITRSGAVPDQVVAIGCQQLGKSAAGLTALLNGRHANDKDSEFADLIAHHHAPNPDLALGWQSKNITSMLDLSDGLVTDLRRIAKASGVAIHLDQAALAEDVAALAPFARILNVDAWDWVLYGGEEHALIATFNSTAEVSPGFRVIGTVSAPQGEPGVYLGARLLTKTGFDHFRSN